MNHRHMNLKDGAVDNWGGHWQKDFPVIPNMKVIGGKEKAKP